MAVAGGAKSAYRMRLVDGTLKIEHTTAMDTPAPLPAMAAILRGETVTVGGFDSAVVQTLVGLQLGINARLRNLIDATNKACLAAKNDAKPGYIVNWANFRCASAEIYMNEFGSFGYRVYVEEAAPENTDLLTFITGELAKAGHEGVTVIAEW